MNTVQSLLDALSSLPRDLPVQAPDIDWDNAPQTMRWVATVQRETHDVSVRCEVCNPFDAKTPGLVGDKRCEKCDGKGMYWVERAPPRQYVLLDLVREENGESSASR